MTNIHQNFLSKSGLNTKLKKRGKINELTSTQMTQKYTAKLYFYEQVVDNQHNDLWRLLLIWSSILRLHNRLREDSFDSTQK